MRDDLGREVDYLRFSVTDRCNLRCVYCMPERGIDLVSHDEVLDFEESALAVRLIARATHIRKLRITGGEPLVRRNVVELISSLRDVPESEMVLTTNGLLLEQMAPSLASAGIARVNVSLDSLDDDRLSMMTRRRVTRSALERGIRAAIDAGLGPVRVNCVIIDGLNDGEIPDMISWAADMSDVEIRFIEHMPTQLGEHRFFPLDAILERAAALGPVATVEGTTGVNSTLEAVYRAGEDRNRFGVIAPLSGSMCKRCNRLRLSCTGSLITCLASSRGVELGDMIRSGREEREMVERIRMAIREKPEGHGGCIRTSMWRIGG